MSWLKLAAGLIKLVQLVVSYMADRQLLAAGEATAISRSLGEQNARLEKALAAGRAARLAAERDGSVPDDKYRRD